MGISTFTSKEFKSFFAGYLADWQWLGGVIDQQKKKEGPTLQDVAGYHGWEKKKATPLDLSGSMMGIGLGKWSATGRTKSVQEIWRFPGMGIPQ